MLSINDFYKNESDYLKAGDIPAGKKVPLVINSVGTVTFNEGKPEQQIKIAVGFEGTHKKLTINKTNGMVIAQVLGDDAESWTGGKIFVYSTKVQFGDKMVDAIRVEMPLEEAALGSAQQQSYPTQSAPLPGQTNQPMQDPENFDDDIPF